MNKTGYITHLSVSEWGETLHIMDVNGFAFCSISRYNESPDIFIIHGLHVVEQQRQKGYATRLIEYCENYAKNHGAITIRLKVLKDSWMRNWYKRKGYKRTSQSGVYIWKIKQI